MISVDYRATTQKILEFLRNALIQKPLMGVHSGLSSRGEMIDPEDSDGFSSVFAQCLVGFLQRLFVGALFSTQCGFSGNRTSALLPGQPGFHRENDSLSETRDGCYVFHRHHIHSCMSLGDHEQPLLTQLCVSRLFCTGVLRLLGGSHPLDVRPLSFMCIHLTPASRTSCVHWPVSCTHRMLGKHLFVGLAVVRVTLSSNLIVFPASLTSW